MEYLVENYDITHNYYAGRKQKYKNVYIKGIEMTGFKCFSQQVICGPLPGPAALIAVVGPNGCGKSVIGEAIAFVLGGNKRMLRAKYLETMINQKCLDDRQEFAKVLIMVIGTCMESGEQVSLLVQRVCSRSMTHTKMCVLKGSAASVPVFFQDDPSLNMTVPESTLKHVSQEELYHHLILFGINTKVIERFVVMQSRQAVDVQDPLRLLNMLEDMLGTSSIAETIRDFEIKVSESNKRIDVLEDEVERLSMVRERLAPEVARWHDFHALQTLVNKRSSQMLIRNERLLHDKIQDCLLKIENLQKEAANVDSRKSHALETLQDATKQRMVALRKVKDLDLNYKNACRQADTFDAEAEAVKLQVFQAEEEEKSRAQQQSLIQNRLSKLEDKLLATQVQEKSAQIQLESAENLRMCLKANILLSECKSAHGIDPFMYKEEQPGDLCIIPSVDITAAMVEGDVKALKKQISEASFATKRARGQHATARRRAQEVTTQLNAAMQHRQQKLVAFKDTEDLIKMLDSKVHAAAESSETLQVGITAERARLADLQDAQLTLQVELQHLEEEIRCYETTGCRDGAQSEAVRNHNGSSRDGWHRRYDKAVADLYQRNPKHSTGQHCQLGFLYGWLCNVFHVTEVVAIRAVNAVMREVSAMSTTLVVSDRDTAYNVMTTFRSQHIGKVTCKVLSELRPGRPMGDQYFELPGGYKARRLQALVSYDETQVPGAHKLLSQLLYSWALIEDKAMALQIMASQKQLPRGHMMRWNLVTWEGEVFKADGEIVVSLNSRSNNAELQVPHCLGLTAKPVHAFSDAVIEDVSVAGGMCKQDPEQTSKSLSLKDKASSITLQCHNLRQKIQNVQSSLRASAAKERQLQSVILQDTRAIAAAHTKFKSLEKDLHNVHFRILNCAVNDSDEGSSSVMQHFRPDHCNDEYIDQLASKVSLLQSEEMAAAELVKECEAVHKSLNEKLGTFQTIIRDGSCTALDSRSPSVLDDHGRMKDAIIALRKATSQMQALKAEGQRISAQVEKQESLLKQQEQYSKSKESIQMLRKKQGKLLVQAEKEREVAEKLDTQLSLLKERADVCTTEVQAQQAKLDALATKSAESQQAVALCISERADLDKELQVVIDEKEECSRISRGCDNSINCAAESSHQVSGLTWDPKRESSLDQQLEDRDDLTVEPQHAGPGIRESLRRRKGGGGKIHSEEQAFMQLCNSPKKHGLKKGSRREHMTEDKWIKEERSYLSAKRLELTTLRNAINTSALKEDLDASEAMEEAQQQVAVLESQVTTDAAARDALVNERYMALSTALSCVNQELSLVYQFLTSWVGDAYLQYTSDKLLLFTTGITLNVRPDSHKWRPFNILSGGQQAMAALAVSFAFQSAFPCPFYFFDEVDSALDTLNAQRISDYMLLRSRGERPSPPIAVASSSSLTLVQCTREATTSAGADPEINKRRGYTGHDAEGLDPVQRQHSVQQGFTQYIVVSHKPQVFERAECLIGVYSHKGTSLTATAYFPEVK
ncbi:hypothetical protein CEUSTIGMA_g7471.t1 [Chlamydomonas eustigma]|uniref:RecF/RecN/SMC N-terminal domain-containing protein n=1 Tax=Chlamydomonas eustigma TaxID=1157962 RepID=A0A250XAX9_9CHLO|nr:hypothetical protein CEUSTIGMA_g7471.t1 [Chlamydomonas eustigma]|eukprot:GAX80032.1 hypothetical protein CEUSTIGMA_g7471.t1 [Chlamydomonas eustigma]